MGDMREIRPDPPDTRKIKYPLKRADVDMLEKLAQGEDQEEITVTSYDLGMVNMAVLQIGDISAYSSGTKFGILLALKILGEEDK